MENLPVFFIPILPSGFKKIKYEISLAFIPALMKKTLYPTPYTIRCQ